MTLYASDYLEYYLTLVGWLVNNGIWNVLVASGIVALPFLVIVIQEWLRSRTERADEGNKGVLSSVHIEQRVWVAILVITFAGIPIVPVTLSTIQFDRSRSLQCHDPVRDAGLAEVPSGGGYPSCQQWWSDADDGLRARLLTQVEPDLLLRFRRWAGFLSQDDVDDAVIRVVASPRQQIVNHGQAYTDYGGRIGMTAPNLATRIASDLGIMIGTLAYVPAMDAVRQALPMVLSVLKMALVICLPLLLVVGTYELKAVVIVSCVQFAVFFLDFWFQLARWVDSTIMDALYGWDSPHSNFNALLGLNNTFQDMILNWFVLPTMFLVLPGFWIAALSWVGISAGNALRGLSDATVDARNAGRSGSNVIMKTLK